MIIEKPVKMCRICGNDSNKVRFRRKRGKCSKCENEYQKARYYERKQLLSEYNEMLPI